MAVANLYDLEDGPHSFVHPGVVVSGLLHRAGLGVVAAYMVWKPVAVLVLFAGALALVTALPGGARGPAARARARAVLRLTGGRASLAGRASAATT